MVHSSKESTESIIIANKEIVLEVNADKTKYMVILRDQNARRYRSIKIDYNSFEKLVVFKHLGKPLMNQNVIHDEIKKSLNSRHVFITRCRIFCFSLYYLKVQRLRYTELKFCLLSCMGVKLSRSYSGRNVG